MRWQWRCRPRCWEGESLVLNVAELDKFFERHFHRRAFRLEVRDAYEVASDGGDFARYMAGEALPDATRKNAWLDELRADSARGKAWQWVHVVRSPLSDYLRYEFEWGYAINIGAGADVRVLDSTERPRPAGLINEDFWLLDDQAALIMVYDDANCFVGAEPVPTAELPRYRRAQAVAWKAAQSFGDYWAEHPHYHRARAA
jgi:hypothetical protein